jgi:hypothetical protein
MNNQFEKMQKLAFGKIIIESETPHTLTESTLRDKIKEIIHSSLGEAKKKKKDVAPQDDSVELDMSMDTEEPTVDTGMEMPTDTMSPEVSNEIDIDPKVKAIQDSLSKALANAKALGDEKLVNQIGNTITMLVRTQVVGQQVAESLDEIQGEEYDDDTIDPKDYADDYTSNKVDYLANTLQYVWNMGKGNNSIDFDDMAKSISNDLETRF